MLSHRDSEKALVDSLRCDIFIQAPFPRLFLRAFCKLFKRMWRRKMTDHFENRDQIARIGSQSNCWRALQGMSSE